MWPYDEVEQAWLSEKPAIRVKPSPYEAELPEYFRPETAVYESVEFHRERAHAMRNEAIGEFFGGIATEAAAALRQLAGTKQDSAKPGLLKTRTA